MASEKISIWFDLVRWTHVMNPYREGASMSGQAPVGSILVRNIYSGSLDDAQGQVAMGGLWQWQPRYMAVRNETEFAYPLPESWKKPFVGGWSWDRDKHRGHIFLALTKSAGTTKRVGAIANLRRDFKVEDFKELPGVKRNYDEGTWLITDGDLRIQGSWQFVRLVHEK